MSEWQPIETAPKDGTWVLCFGDPNDEGADGPERNIFTAQFSHYLNGNRYEVGCWMFAWFDGGYYGKCTPTHWMPLPAPPTENLAKSMQQKTDETGK